MKILVAGASGALGHPLLVQLLQAGHQVWGMAQRAQSLKNIKNLGATPVQGNALDRTGVFAMMAQLRPDCVVDQLTSLPASPLDLPQCLPADRVLRLQGGGHLFDAAVACGVGRYIQQSCGFYLNGNGGLAGEEAPLAIAAPGHIGESARMYAALEKRVMGTPTLQGTVLRYGFFYGPRTWYWPDGAFTDLMRQRTMPLIGGGEGVFSFIHVDDAARATVSALAAPGGVYNVVDDQSVALRLWLPAYARWVGAPAPPSVAVQVALEQGGEESVYYQTRLSGATNGKARRILGLEPCRQPWMPR
ncbi:NAD-dependent epimerase/dehydratase family protein [Acetobacter syzygii]|uniref:Steroid protein related protein n=1 Tax=Acetobacter syzygii TaxID=146476 RepID=A0A270BEQ2_9PROT|nr:NAD(P)-dependent oxidoreductase [Acetobacter syzygii]PAL23464.1 steroid protein related protein [Acetobacter syzygii]PAL24144.1 steroid protein related protein [Acetobacter syzygii]